MNRKRILFRGISHGIIILMTFGLYYFNKSLVDDLCATFYPELSPLAVVFFLGLFISSIGPVNRMKKEKFLAFTVCYLPILFLTLFGKQKYSEATFSNGKYLFEWFSLMSKDRIVFFNIVSNLLLFLPLGMIVFGINVPFRNVIVKTLFITLVPLIIIILCEAIQYLTKTGVFDLGDIVLNYIGVGLGIAIIGINEVFDKEHICQKNKKES